MQLLTERVYQGKPVYKNTTSRTL